MQVARDRGRDRELVVTGRWSVRHERVVRAGEFDRLVLNYALGFDEASLSFLDGLPLRGLVVLDPRLVDLGPVHSLGATLEQLSLTAAPEAKVDLRQIPHLTEIGAPWALVEATIGFLGALRVAHLRGYSEPDLLPLSQLSDLTELVLKDRPALVSLEGVRPLTRLQTLGVHLGRRLSDVDDLIEMSRLEVLALEACRKIDGLEPLRGCTRLRRLNMAECGSIRSLQPLVALTELEELDLHGSTIIADGDLGPIAALPRLRDLRMRSRSTYAPRVEDILLTLPRA